MIYTNHTINRAVFSFFAQLALFANCLVLLFQPIKSWAEQTPTPSSKGLTEVRVTLFGQTCLLTGPAQLNEETLNKIHSLSPEKLPPAQDSKEVRRLRTLIRQAGTLPGNLEIYREKMVKRLDAQLAFFEGMAAAKNAKNPSMLNSSVQGFLSEKGRKEFEQTVASFWKSKPERIKENFENLIEPYPEEEFHRVIERMGIRYTCTFEENDQETIEQPANPYLGQDQ